MFMLHALTVLLVVTSAASICASLWVWLMPTWLLRSLWGHTFFWCAIVVWLLLDNLSLAFDLRLCYHVLAEMVEEHGGRTPDTLPQLLRFIHFRYAVLQGRSVELSRASLASAHWSLFAEKAKAMYYVAKVRRTMDKASSERSRDAASADNGYAKILMGGSMRVRRSGSMCERI